MWPTVYLSNKKNVEAAEGTREREKEEGRERVKRLYEKYVSTYR